MGTWQDLTGMKFGKLTPVSYEKRSNGKSVWKCICDCGNTSYVRSADVTAETPL